MLVLLEVATQRSGASVQLAAVLATFQVASFQVTSVSVFHLPAKPGLTAGRAAVAAAT
jgi:hypothetical protein